MARREGTRSSGRPADQDDGRSPTRLFHLLRLADESGVSGTGRVAEGVIFSNGWVALLWLTETPSMGFYPSIEAVEAIHGHSGKTRVVFD
jgi:hypothetical protein